MYFLMFLSCVICCLNGDFKSTLLCIPGSKLGVLTVCSLGMFGSGLGFVVSFLEPDLNTGLSSLQYTLILICLAILLCSPPFIYKYFKAKQ